MIRPINNDWPDWQATWKWLAQWRNAVSGPAKTPDRLLLWVDSVGGYLVCLRDEVVLGQPAGGVAPDVPLLADLSRRQAVIRRQGECYSIEAVRQVRVDSHTVKGTAPLWDGSVIELGEAVRLRFRRPHPLSATARLEFISRHRTQPSTDGILLMADSCILGPASTSHVVTSRWQHEIVLFRQASELACRTSAQITVDGAKRKGRSPLRPSSRVEGEEFAFSLEPLAEK